jgi:hypothetical protein
VGYQRRKKSDHPDIGQQKTERAVRLDGIEGRHRGAQTVGSAKKRAQLIGDFERFRRRLHCVPVSDEQGIGKLRAEMPQHLADTGLRGGQELRRPRDAAFVQQRVQDPQLAQVQFG